MTNTRIRSISVVLDGIRIFGSHDDEERSAEVDAPQKGWRIFFGSNGKDYKSGQRSLISPANKGVPMLYRFLIGKKNADRTLVEPNVVFKFPRSNLQCQSLDDAALQALVHAEFASENPELVTHAGVREKLHARIDTHNDAIVRAFVALAYVRKMHRLNATERASSDWISCLADRSPMNNLSLLINSAVLKPHHHKDTVRTGANYVPLEIANTAIEPAQYIRLARACTHELYAALSHRGQRFSRCTPLGHATNLMCKALNVWSKIQTRTTFFRVQPSFPDRFASELRGKDKRYPLFWVDDYEALFEKDQFRQSCWYHYYVPTLYATSATDERVKASVKSCENLGLSEGVSNSEIDKSNIGRLLPKEMMVANDQTLQVDDTLTAIGKDSIAKSPVQLPTMLPAIPKDAISQRVSRLTAALAGRSSATPTIH